MQINLTSDPQQRSARILLLLLLILVLCCMELSTCHSIQLSVSQETCADANIKQEGRVD
jgi:hypothetical protein